MFTRSTGTSGAPGYGRGLLRRATTSLELDTRLLAMLGALGLIWLGFHLLSGGSFLTARNLWNLSVQSSVVGVISVGMVLVIVTRNIDLSVGSLLGFIAMVMAVLQVDIFPLGAPWNWAATVACGVALGALMGAFQGYWIAYLNVPAFIVTLGGLLIFRGGAWLVTSGRTVAPLDPTFQVLGGGIGGSIGAFWSWVVGLGVIALIVWSLLRTRTRRQKYNFPVKPLWAEGLMIAALVLLVVGFVMVMNAYPRPGTTIPRGIPVPVLIVLAVAVTMAAVVRFTKFGRYVFAIGGNPEAARLSGIDTRKIILKIFIIMGVLCAIAGVIASARLNAGANATGTLAELSVIAAAVIGGTSLAGGVGSIPGAILGTVLMESLRNGMVLIGLPSALQNVIQGFVLILAVWLDVVYQRRRQR